MTTKHASVEQQKAQQHSATTKLNVLDKICSMVVKTKKTMKYHVTTIHGQSEKYYTHDIKHPVHGSGQGSGNAGSEWNFISIPILKTMEQEADGYIIIGPRGQE